MVRGYTTIEQSRKLAEILPLESADMFYNLGESKLPNVIYGNYDDFKCYIPCWSLTALLSVLPDDCGIDKEDGKYVASYLVSNECGTYINDNPVDACVSMIEYLHELNLL